MTTQRKVLPKVVDAIQSYHPNCSIILFGSVARHEERPSSDLDLQVFLPDDSVRSPWVDPTNRWQLKVMSEMDGIRIDVAWETLDFFEAEVETDGPFWIISCGELICDPSGRAKPCLEKIRSWADQNVELCQKLEAEFRVFKKKQLARRREQT